MYRDLHGLRVLITGSSGAIGRSVAEAASFEGARLALTAQSAEILNTLTQRLASPQATLVAIPADITQERERQRIIDTSVARLGGIDVLINCAGAASAVSFAESSEEALRQVMELNFFAPVELIRLAIPEMRKGRQPAIVNVSSICGRRGLPICPEYSATMFALCGMTEALRGEMARFDIDVLLVLPSLTRTDVEWRMTGQSRRIHGSFADILPPERVAEKILDAVQLNRAETVVGREARWMLRWQRFVPRLLDRWIMRRAHKLYG